MGFLVLAKHGLNKNLDKTKFGLKLGERTVERERKERGRKRRRGREEEEKKRKRKEGDQASQDQEVWNYMVLYGFLV